LHHVVILLRMWNDHFSYTNNEASRKECCHNRQMVAVNQNSCLTDIGNNLIGVETKSMIAAANRCVRSPRQIFR
jgi:hypothetical protein